MTLARQHSARETAAEFPGLLDLAGGQDPRRATIEGVRSDGERSEHVDNDGDATGRARSRDMVKALNLQSDSAYAGSRPRSGPWG